MRIAAKRLRYVLEVTGFVLRRAGRHRAPPRARPPGHPRRDPRLRRDAAAGARAPRGAAAARRQGSAGEGRPAHPTSTPGWRPRPRTGPPIADSTSWPSISRHAASCSTTASPPSGAARRRPAPGCGSSAPSTATCSAPGRRAAPRRRPSAPAGRRRRLTAPPAKRRHRPNRPASTASAQISRRNATRSVTSRFSVGPAPRRGARARRLSGGGHGPVAEVGESAVEAAFVDQVEIEPYPS